MTIPQAEGHARQHNGPIFTPDGPASWGDIIPPISTVPEGRNWPEGRAILENGCEVAPDPGPLPSALIADVECDGVVPRVQATVSNAADATDQAIVDFFIDGDFDQRVTVAPGDTQTVALSSASLAARGTDPFPIEARTGGTVLTSKVVTVDCAEPTPPEVEINAEVTCDGPDAIATVTATNNGEEAVTVTTSIDGEPFGEALVVAAGGTATKTDNVSQFEDQTVTIEVFVDGDLVATYTPTPDCQQSPDPDPGPLPSALIADVECDGVVPRVQATVSNAADATDQAIVDFYIDGEFDQTVGPVAPGESQTVALSSDLLASRGSDPFPIEARSGGAAVASKVVTVDCAPPPPGVEILAELACDGPDALATITATNNGAEPVTVTTSIDGEPFGDPLVVAAGETETKTDSIAQFEDQTITIEVFVDGELVATYTPTPDCDQTAVPRVAVAALQCPPGSATATLANDGDPASSVVFTVLVNGGVEQVSAPLYGGDETTIVGDLEPYEDRNVVIDLLANGEVLGSRTIYVDCRRNASTVAGPGAGGSGNGSGNGSGSVQVGVVAKVLPATGATSDRWLGGLGGCLLLGGAFLLLVGRRGTTSS